MNQIQFFVTVCTQDFGWLTLKHKLLVWGFKGQVKKCDENVYFMHIAIDF